MSLTRITWRASARITFLVADTCRHAYRSTAADGNDAFRPITKSVVVSEPGSTNQHQYNV